MRMIRLKPGRERSVLQRHPWIFSGSVAEVSGDPQPGETVDVHAHDGAWLAKAAYSPQSQIRARIWTWQSDEEVDESFLARRLDEAIQARVDLAVEPEVDAYREVYAESDRLPGLIIDRYGSFRVLQLLNAGAERWRDAIVSHLASRRDCEALYERSDVDVRALEGLQARKGLLWGREPPESLIVHEHGMRYHVDLVSGHKTGFYLDQRDNRRYLRQHFPGGEVLDAFCYSGGFTLAALAAGAENVLAIDASQPSLELAQRNVELNDLLQERCEWLQGDVFQELRTLRDRGRSFDVVILDPPRFAPTASQAQKASRGYKDINLLAFKLLRPGGTLISYSCSGGISPDLFRKIIAGAALDAGVRASILAWQSQPHDHPVVFNFPEGRYLKGLICRVHPID
ncbi:MAG TPA: methyltransferase domain-containing protein [Anaerolineae bacterium]|nr:methyltransferase domain-containing protein [Anaerolineae bacterium]